MTPPSAPSTEPSAEISAILDTMRSAAREAGDVLRAHRGKLRSIEFKGAIDIVTEADKASEAVILRHVRERHPDHAILAEESGASGSPGAPGTGADVAATPQFQWIIDPLDGTTNYAHGIGIFSVSIAVRRAGKAVAGIVYAPAQEEIYEARAGGGATLNGTPIRVSTVADLNRALLVTGFPYDRRSRMDHYMALLGTFLTRSQGVLRLGSAAFDLCQVASGRLEGFWEENLAPWDTAAGELILREAGGRITDFENKPFSPFGKKLLATNGLLHEAMLETLRGK